MSRILHSLHCRRGRRGTRGVLDSGVPLHDVRYLEGLMYYSPLQLLNDISSVDLSPPNCTHNAFKKGVELESSCDTYSQKDVQPYLRRHSDTHNKGDTVSVK